MSTGPLFLLWVKINANLKDNENLTVSSNSHFFLISANLSIKNVSPVSLSFECWTNPFGFLTDFNTSHVLINPS
jgi:hypothetical protein